MGVSIEARGLCKSIAGKRVLDHTEFFVKEGQCFGVVGQSLSGKTVLLRLLSSQWIPDEGEVFVHEISTKANPAKIKRMVGYVPQQEGFDEDLTAIDNLLIFAAYFGLGGSKAVLRAREVLRGVEMDHLDDHIVRHLPAWQRRRLCMARAILTRPEVLVLDHPTTGLDREQKSWINRWIRARMKEGLTTILSTNYFEEAELLCNEIIILEKGKVICKGEPKTLIESYVGREVLEYRVNPQDLEYHLRSIQGHFTYQVLTDHIRIFLPQASQGIEAAKAISSDNIQIRRASLRDVYAKLLGREMGV